MRRRGAAELKRAERFGAEPLAKSLVPALDACEAGESSMLDEITARFDAVSECRARVPGFLDGVLGFSKSECVTEWPVSSQYVQMGGAARHEVGKRARPYKLRISSVQHIRRFRSHATARTALTVLILCVQSTVQL